MSTSISKTLAVIALFAWEETQRTRLTYGPPARSPNVSPFKLRIMPERPMPRAVAGARQAGRQRLPTPAKTRSGSLVSRLLVRVTLLPGRAMLPDSCCEVVDERPVVGGEISSELASPA